MSEPRPVEPTRPRIAPVVALTILEVIRDQDLPSEILVDEDPSVTMPRRLGLSEVVEAQIRRYQGDVKKGKRASDEEIRNLFHLVIRRPDSEEVFLEAGRRLAFGGEETRPTGGWRRILPGRLAFALARRRVRKRLRSLFGRAIGGYGPGPFTIEGRALLFIQNDPGGEACLLLSGFCEAMVRRKTGREVIVSHVACQARGDDVCRWTAREADPSEAAGQVGLEAGPGPVEAAGD